MIMNVREQERERELTLLKAHAFESASGWELTLSRYKALLKIWHFIKSHYNAYVINVHGRFVPYFHLHYQVIPKIACMFSKAIVQKTF